MLIDSIMGTIDHIYCDNTFHVITEQNHRRNTIVCHPWRIAGLANNVAKAVLKLQKYVKSRVLTRLN